MTRRNQYDALAAEEAQGSQETLRSEDLDSLISSKFAELLSEAGVKSEARYDGRAGIASRKSLEVPSGHFGYAARLDNKSQRSSIEKPIRFAEYMQKHRSKLIDAEQQWMESLCDFCAVSQLSEHPYATH